MTRRLDPQKIPPPVRKVGEVLASHGFQAYLVGGSVRDMLLGDAPNDFDIATDARPWEVAALFPHTIPVGAAFGSVLVEIEGGFVDVTTFRKEHDYVDGRRPSRVEYADAIEDDLARRDFTVNAIAWDMASGRLADPHGGLDDLEACLIRAVGDPVERFREDALRTLRAVRLAARLSFDIELDTWRALETEAQGVRRLSAERVRDELFKILEVDDVQRALGMLRESGLLFEILPELKEADRVASFKPGQPTLLDHLILTAAGCPPDPLLRFAGLLHDLGKISTRAIRADGRVTYHGHARAGAELARRIGTRLRLSKREIERMAGWIERHMSVDPSISAKTLRRWMLAWDKEWLIDLVHLCRADAWASGWQGEIPYLDRVQQEVEEIHRRGEALPVRRLAIDGHDVMRELGIGPGPRVGEILSRLHEAVLEDPAKNTREALLQMARAWGTGKDAEPGDREGENADER